MAATADSWSEARPPNQLSLTERPASAKARCFTKRLAAYSKPARNLTSVPALAVFV